MPRGGYRVGSGRPKNVVEAKPRKPKGKPLTERVKLQLADMAQLHTEDAIKCLAAIMADGTNENARISAAKEILDRGHGKAVQKHEGDAPDTQILVVTHVPRHSDTTDAIDVEHSPVLIEAAE